jgi:ketosteroid isomerase-like protein
MIAAFVLGACATRPVSLPDASPLVGAERAFAARAGEIGWVPAFREFVAPNGQLVGQDGYANAPEQLAEAPDDGVRTLFWWPAFAAMSRSGDFGFTTGPVSFDEARTPRGHYFTVWRRQPDGTWKWIYDGGVGPMAEPGLIAPDAPAVPTAPTSANGEASADAAIAAVSMHERSGGFVGRLAPDAQVFRTRQPRRVGADAGSAFSEPAGVSYRVSRIEASSGGDLVMVLGEASWTADGQALNGLYARMWQHRPDGWRIIYDQLIVPRPNPPPG